jgi:hypothetical protein
LLVLPLGIEYSTIAQKGQEKFWLVLFTPSLKYAILLRF